MIFPCCCSRLICLLKTAAVRATGFLLLKRINCSSLDRKFILRTCDEWEGLFIHQLKRAVIHCWQITFTSTHATSCCYEKQEHVEFGEITEHEILLLFIFQEFFYLHSLQSNNLHCNNLRVQSFIWNICGIVSTNYFSCMGAGWGHWRNQTEYIKGEHSSLTAPGQLL